MSINVSHIIMLHSPETDPYGHWFWVLVFVFILQISFLSCRSLRFWVLSSERTKVVVQTRCSKGQVMLISILWNSPRVLIMAMAVIATMESTDRLYLLLKKVSKTDVCFRNYGGSTYFPVFLKYARYCDFLRWQTEKRGIQFPVRYRSLRTLPPLRA